MPAQPAPAKIIRTRTLDVVAEWVKGEPIFAEVEVPYEDLAPGPRGYRVHVIDYDASTRTLSPPPAKFPVSSKDPEDRDLHAQNVYALVMRTLERFQFALGRNVGWSFGGHQIYVAPHAFRDANAYYSREHHGLFFGYYREDKKNRYMCLSHDVVAHETTHALLDGLRRGYYYAALPDQAAFHEAFGDLVALLSMFSLPRAALTLLRHAYAETEQQDSPETINTVERSWFEEPSHLRKTALLGVGDGFGERGEAMRRSAEMSPESDLLQSSRYQEEHDRGEILVAAVMTAFLKIWMERIRRIAGGLGDKVDLTSVANEGCTAAEQLLTMCIRAIDYSPCATISFNDFLSALLTADFEVQNDDSKYGYRGILRKTFVAYGIDPVKTNGREANLWEGLPRPLDLRNTHFEAVQRDPDAMFRLIWQNRDALDVCEQAYTEVRSLRPCVRVSWDGFVVRETVAEYVEMLTLTAGELQKYGIGKPAKMPPGTTVRLLGGGVLIFDEYGAVKYHVKQSVLNPERQKAFVAHLWKTGYYDGESEDKGLGFGALHRARMLGLTPARRNSHELF